MLHVLSPPLDHEGHTGGGSPQSPKSAHSGGGGYSQKKRPAEIEHELLEGLAALARVVEINQAAAVAAIAAALTSDLDLSSNAAEVLLPPQAQGDKVELVQARQKQKLACPEGWTGEVERRFKHLLNSF
jgi:hypothetical protein